MTGEQCRKARERLDCTRSELATAADVPAWFIAAFEDGRATPDFLADYQVDLRVALQEAGVEFIAERTAAGQGRGSPSRAPIALLSEG